MKIKNRENMQRAIGALEGLRVSASEKQEFELNNVICILDCILYDEPTESEDTE